MGIFGRKDRIGTGGVHKIPLAPTERVAPMPSRGMPLVRASSTSFDAGVNSRTNERHWNWANNLDADSNASQGTRERLRSRSRYEADNNPYARGMIDQLSGDVVGTAPRLQLHTEDLDLNQFVEKSWERWSHESGYPVTCRLDMKSKVQDGEYLNLASNNDRLRHPVKLWIREVEVDRLQNPFGERETAEFKGGIKFDGMGRPLDYYILRHHPGAVNIVTTPQDFEVVGWENAYHGFKKDRPGQTRGVPEFAPALELFAQLRRYGFAVLDAAEMAANLSMIMHINGEHIEPTGAEADDLNQVDVQRGTITQIPDGFDITQMKAEQPTTGLSDYKRTNIQEIGRTIGMPYGKAAADSSDYNYSSGRLDLQTYERKIMIERQELTVFLDWTLSLWLQEFILWGIANRVSGIETLMTEELVAHTWHFDAFKHVDPTKEARAMIELVEAGLNNLQDYGAIIGRDWRDIITQRGEEERFAASQGVNLPYLIQDTARALGAKKIASKEERELQEWAADMESRMMENEELAGAR